jgi:hypothetical protein
MKCAYIGRIFKKSIGRIFEADRKQPISRSPVATVSRTISRTISSTVSKSTLVSKAMLVLDLVVVVVVVVVVASTVPVPVRCRTSTTAVVSIEVRRRLRPAGAYDILSARASAVLLLARAPVLLLTRRNYARA